MSIDFDQLPKQILAISVDIQQKEESIAFLEQEQIGILNSIKSEPFGNNMARLDQTEKNAQLIEELHHDIQLLKRNQRILEILKASGQNEIWKREYETRKQNLKGGDFR